jgi:hypothetical protein
MMFAISMVALCLAAMWRLWDYEQGTFFQLQAIYFAIAAIYEKIR